MHSGRFAHPLINFVQSRSLFIPGVFFFNLVKKMRILENLALIFHLPFPRRNRGCTSINLKMKMMLSEKQLVCR